MKQACLALITTCLISSHLFAQHADGPGQTYQNLWSPWSYPAYYSYYEPYYDELHTQKNLQAYWSSQDERQPPQPIVTGTAAPPPPPATPVVHEYQSPEQENAPAPFSIVTTTGALYLATMIWVEGDNLHFNSAEGGVFQIPLSSVSRPLPQTANAQKNLNLRLPSTHAGTPNVEATPEDQPRSALPASVVKARQ